MTLSHKSWLVRYAYFFSSWGVPSSTTLCDFFWQMIGTTLLWSFWASIAIGLLYVIITGWKAVLLAAAGTLVVVTVISIMVLIIKTANSGISKHETLSAIKGRLCPRIEID